MLRMTIKADNWRTFMDLQREAITAARQGSRKLISEQGSGYVIMETDGAGIDAKE